MNRLLKALLFTTAAAGVALVGWRFAASGTRPPRDLYEPSTNGDFAAQGEGAAGELTKEQREKLLEELEDQLGA